MRRLDGLESLPLELARPVVTVGTFDGVHRGHQRVLGEVIEWAAALGARSVVVTFTRPPKSTLDDRPSDCLTSLEHRLLLFERMGVDDCVVLEFTAELASVPAGDFCRKVLVDGLGARGLVVGYDAAFGRDREGGVAFLEHHAPEFGFEVRSLGPVTYEGEVVSSTRIRRVVGRGDLSRAEALLGRPFSVYGTVVHGDARGRKLGFPTANLDLHHEIAPPDGVYVAEAVLGASTLPALASVGTHPTFARTDKPGGAARLVEVHILDFDEEIYGRDLEVRFHHRLRGQRAFADAEALVRQMQDDLRLARPLIRELLGDTNDGETP